MTGPMGAKGDQVSITQLVSNSFGLKKDFWCLPHFPDFFVLFFCLALALFNNPAVSIILFLYRVFQDRRDSQDNR